jgi:hypothetical protein
MKTIAAKTRTGGRLDHAVSGTTTALRRSSCLWTLDQVALDLSPADHRVAEEGVWSIARFPLRSDADRVRFAPHLFGLTAEADAPTCPRTRRTA